MLICCPECKKQVSSEAFFCVHCGYVVRLGDIQTKKKWLESYEDHPGIVVHKRGEEGIL